MWLKQEPLCQFADNYPRTLGCTDSEKCLVLLGSDPCCNRSLLGKALEPAEL